MRRFWLSRTLSLGIVLATTAVRAANPLSSKLWTLVGCDNVDLDSLISDVTNLADAAISSINNIVDGAVIGVDDGSTAWFHARNAMIFWGLWGTYSDDQKQLHFEGNDLAILNKVKDKYQGIVSALLGGYWSPNYNWVFCKPDQQPYPFVKATVVKDFVNNMPADIQDKPLSDFNIPDNVYYPDAGFSINANDPSQNGRRRIGLIGSDPNVCNVADSPAAFIYLQEHDSTTHWMALCNVFYNSPATVSPNIPDDAFNLDLYKSQASQLLHELMHFRWSDVTDYYGRIGSMTKDDHFYGSAGCAALGDDSNRAMANADNYRLFAEASYLQPRRWEVDPKKLGQSK